MFLHVNQLILRLSNDATAHGLELARVSGAPSLEVLIERLLLGANESAASHLASGSTAPARGGPTHDEVVGVVGALDINPPALGLERPKQLPTIPLAGGAPRSKVGLPFLMNRFSPLKGSVRALANLAIRDGEWPQLRDFQAEAGHAARACGVRLLSEDRATGRRAREKRSVAWPIGSNPASALERYAFAFTLSLEGQTPAGPLATLGLATVVDGRAALTKPGWELASAPSPVLDGGDGTLSDDEIVILRDRLLQAPSERQAIVEFLSAVRRAAGAQPRVDELLSTWHAEWSADQAAAQRSAMIGRLSELGVLNVSGRGGKAAIRLGNIESFEDEVNERSAA
jgi:hypothetical protein